MYRLKVTRRYYSALPENLETFKSVFAEWERLECGIVTIELRYVITWPECTIIQRIVSETLRRTLGVTPNFCPERFRYNVFELSRG